MLKENDELQLDYQGESEEDETVELLSDCYFFIEALLEGEKDEKWIQKEGLDILTRLKETISWVSLH